MISERSTRLSMSTEDFVIQFDNSMEIFGIRTSVMTLSVPFTWVETLDEREETKMGNRGVRSVKARSQSKKRQIGSEEEETENGRALFQRRASVHLFSFLQPHAPSFLNSSLAFSAPTLSALQLCQLFNNSPQPIQNHRELLRRF